MAVGRARNEIDGGEEGGDGSVVMLCNAVVWVGV